MAPKLWSRKAAKITHKLDELLLCRHSLKRLSGEKTENSKHKQRNNFQNL